jgi:hypothetical protein
MANMKAVLAPQPRPPESGSFSMYGRVVVKMSPTAELHPAPRAAVLERRCGAPDSATYVHPPTPGPIVDAATKMERKTVKQTPAPVVYSLFPTTAVSPMETRRCQQ